MFEILFKDLFNKINISYKCLSGVFFSIFEKHKSSSNSNMLIYDASNLNSSHWMIEF